MQQAISSNSFEIIFVYEIKVEKNRLTHKDVRTTTLADIEANSNMKMTIIRMKK